MKCELFFLLKIKLKYEITLDSLLEVDISDATDR